MIALTKLNGQQFVLNADLIRYVETCPDTLITLTVGDNIMVRESMEEVIKRTIAYQQEKNVIPYVKTLAESVIR